MKYNNKFTCFKAYDIRGCYPNEINEDFAYTLAIAISRLFKPKSVTIGFDPRLSSLNLLSALAKSFFKENIFINSLSICGTEEVYYASGIGLCDLGIMITGSHNPANENGFKIIKRGGFPITSNEINDLKSIFLDLQQKDLSIPSAKLNIPRLDERQKFLNFLQEITNSKSTKNKNLKVLVDCGNGSAGVVMQELAPLLPFEIIPLNWEPDGNFPNGVPNPLLPEKRELTSKAVIASGADIGIAFDGDFDRCFFYDHEGNFIDGYYIVGLLAAAILKGNPGEKIIHDPRLYWNTQKIVRKHKGIPIMSKTGHAFIKEKMRSENAIYGGEMSSHHYYRDFFYCDSGMLTMLYVLSLLGNSPIPLSEMIAQSKTAYPISGEINYKTDKKDELLDIIWNKYHGQALYSDHLDGINLEFKEWRFNIRKSNTESLLRLNIESRGNKNLVEDKVHEIQKIINSNSQ